MSKCPLCAEPVPDGTTRCPLCLVEVNRDGDEVYELPPDADIPDEWQRGAMYALELPARCPHCREIIRGVRVLRLRRTQVSFTSTLPRGGRVITCPACERILSAELTAL